MKLSIKSLAASALSTLLVAAFVCPPRAAAWGQAGHKIVAMIAAEHLDDDAEAEVRRLLGGPSNQSTANKMAGAANWADTIIGQRPETARWHYVNIPRDAAGYNAADHCQNVTDNGQDLGDCIVEAIRRNRETLADDSNSDAARRDALRFVIHFVGDLHQPLHAGFPDDRGGNGIVVRFFGSQMKLHKVWDSGIIGEAQLSERHFADELLALITPSSVPSLQSGSVVGWAEQSWRLAKSNAYAIPANKQLGQTYYNRNWEVVDRRLTEAGLRLARVLNEALP